MLGVNKSLLDAPQGKTRRNQAIIDAQNEKEQEQARQQSLTSCLVDAEIGYYNSWIGECKSQGKTSASCSEVTKTSFDEYVKENNIPNNERTNAVKEFFNRLEECSCRLPLENGDRISQRRKDNKDECYLRFSN